MTWFSLRVTARQSAYWERIQNVKTLDLRLLTKLRTKHRAADNIFHATRYWEHYEASIKNEIAALDFSKINSGLYPYLASFGFGSAPYLPRRQRMSLRPRQFAGEIAYEAARWLVVDRKWNVLPYDLNLGDLQNLAFARAELLALKAGALHPGSIEASMFGAPQDVFYVNGKPYTIQFLTYFCRYCFAQSVINFGGDEVFVELGSGSAMQVEVIKKTLPNSTVLCFDLPTQLFLGYNYICNVFPDVTVDLDDTCDWSDLSRMQKGRIYFFGNWQFPMVRSAKMDVFWNAASFGEMEPHVVKNYLSHVTDKAKSIYLMQARQGKESGLRSGGVVTPQKFEAYCSYLQGYDLVKDQPAERALGVLRDSGGYFEAVWRKRF